MPLNALYEGKMLKNNKPNDMLYTASVLYKSLGHLRELFELSHLAFFELIVESETGKEAEKPSRKLFDDCGLLSDGGKLYPYVADMVKSMNLDGKLAEALMEEIETASPQTIKLPSPFA